MDSRIIAVVAVFLLIGTGAAVVTQTSLVDEILGTSSTLDQMPNDVEVAGQVDMSVLEKDATNEIVKTSLEAAPESGEYSDAENMEDVLDKIEEESNIDPRKIDEVGFYGKSEGDYGAAVIHADMSMENILDSIRENTEFDLEEDSYGGKTVYKTNQSSDLSYYIEQPDTWIGELNSGEYVIGTEEAVKDSIDVENGDAEKLQGEMRDNLESVSGDVRFVADVPDDLIPDSSRSYSQVDLSYLNDIDYLVGDYYIRSQETGFNLKMDVKDEEGAKNVEDVIDGGISLYTGLIEDEDVKEALRSIEIERNQNEVTVSYSQTISEVKESIRSMNQVSGAFLSQPSGTTAP